MNNTLDLHEEFVHSLQKKLPRKGLVNEIADILFIEKDAAYRRLAGKVSFSAREIGIICRKLNISLDGLIHKDEKLTWLPFQLAHPLKVQSMGALFEVIDASLTQIGNITREPGETGNIYCSIPIEFYLYSPVLTKFMFFKWGNYFVGTDEFNDYSKWDIPEEASGLFERLRQVYNFESAYYILDSALIWGLVNEIASFHRMRVITEEDKDAIRHALKDMLTKLEQTLNGTYVPKIGVAPETPLYVSPINLGITSSYYISEVGFSISFQSNFSFCMVEDDPETFRRLKRWIDSFRNISTLLSRSGRIERRVFFDTQHEIVDYMLGKD